MKRVKGTRCEEKSSVDEISQREQQRPSGLYPVSQRITRYLGNEAAKPESAVEGGDGGFDDVEIVYSLGPEKERRPMYHWSCRTIC